MLVWSLGQEEPLEEGTATHSSILAWRIPMDRGAWWATDHGVSTSQIQLKRLSTHAWATPSHDTGLSTCMRYHIWTSQADCVEPKFPFLSFFPTPAPFAHPPGLQAWLRSHSSSTSTTSATLTVTSAPRPWFPPLSNERFSNTNILWIFSSIPI